MTRDEVLERLQHARALFDRRVRAIPPELFDVPVPGGTKTPKQIVAHVAAYEALIVGRLRNARLGETTLYDRDRAGWEIFNARKWAESASADPAQVLEDSNRTFTELIHEIVLLHDDELNSATGITKHVDQSWLHGRSLAEMIAIDGFEHYPKHYIQLEKAAAAAPQV
ncbi:MAG: hypothetical protein CVT60_04990 [Actinobacteria bacterium HGW-Actinobacteria-10]|jgi:hypothetical protein|nr:MAG: hypothetical protein CVT60_04990 [Actinobacteria bacterium HGW-Actinobacteria-10]